MPPGFARAGGRSSHVRVVLVRPESSANIGATARVIRNTGLAGLDLVAAGDWRTLECWRSAWGAQEVLEQARDFDDLGAAIAGAAFVAAFSGRTDQGAPASDVKDVARDIAGLRAGEEASLVFGPEAWGLSIDEIALCGRRARIPSHSQQPSLNLSHAVMVAGYELYRAGRRAVGGPRLASHEQKQQMLELLRQGLLACSALPQQDTGRYFRAWRTLFHRAALTTRELGLLEHMARKMALAARTRRGEGSG